MPNTKKPKDLIKDKNVLGKQYEITFHGHYCKINTPYFIYNNNVV